VYDIGTSNADLEAKLVAQAKAQGKPPEILDLEALYDRLASADELSTKLSRALLAIRSQRFTRFNAERKRQRKPESRRRLRRPWSMRILVSTHPDS
jgi:hypothetical protein